MKNNKPSQFDRGKRQKKAQLPYTWTPLSLVVNNQKTHDVLQTPEAQRLLKLIERPARKLAALIEPTL